MLYQSFSGDAGVGEASFQAVDSTLRHDSDGPMFFVTNTTAKASLQNVALVQPWDTLVNVAAGRWGKSGANGGDFTLTAKDQTLTDDAYVTTLADAATGYTNITSNGHNIYYNADAADDLGGRTYALPGGGKLMPKA